MEFENKGDFYAVWKIKEDLQAEKSRLINSLSDISTSMWANPTDYDKDETIRITLRVEEITAILDNIRLGRYEAP